MKKNVLLFLLAVSSIAVYSQGLENIIVEKYYVSNANDSAGSVGVLPVGSVTYRLFVDLAPSYKFKAAFGNQNHTLYFATTTKFFNNEDRGAKTPTYTKVQAKANTVLLDSWVSVGAACTGNLGVLKTEDNGVATIVNSNGILQNADTMAGIPVSVQDGMVAGTPQAVTLVGIDNNLEVLNDLSQVGNLFSTNNGAWASLNGSKGPTPSNRVLIAQITTKGVFSFHLNIQIQDTITSVSEIYVADSAQTGETMFPGLAYSSNHPPAVSITSPTNGGQFLSGAIIPVGTIASDIDGVVKKVRFYIDGTFLSADTTAPFTASYQGVYGSHIIYCVAIDDVGDSTVSASVQFNVGAGNVNNLNSSVASIRLFPNPAGDFLSVEVISLESNKDLSYKLLDITGNLITEKQIGKIGTAYKDVLNISKLPTGQYIIEFLTGQKSVSGKFTKR